eukprot:12576298-Alexandrium_andersonii.AAC.1
MSKLTCWILGLRACRTAKAVRLLSHARKSAWASSRTSKPQRRKPARTLSTPSMSNCQPE